MDNQTLLINIPVSLGELIDKITILEIKEELITDPEKLVHIKKELTLLKECMPKNLGEDLNGLHDNLKSVNLSIWESEDGLRALKGQHQLSDEEYLTLTRNSHSKNEERFRIKQKINTLGGSSIQEQKSYV